MLFFRFVPLLALLMASAAPAAVQPVAAQPVAAQPAASDTTALGIALEGYAYPHPVQYLSLEAGGEDVRLGYMDVAPTGSENGRAVVLFHGKNFFGAYWENTIQALAGAGYRIIVPDQIGFGKSSKPAIPYSFYRMGRHTRMLLDTLGVEQVAVVGHSMGGMVASRFALMFPERVTHFVLENPIGLEDYSEKVPYVPTDELYRNELAKTEESIRSYQEGYYVEWRPAYDEYVQVHYRWTLGGEYPRLARASALTAQMIYEQPVIEDFPLIEAPALLVIGQEDRTALGKGRVDAVARQALGQYPELGQAAAEALPDARLVPLEGVGHLPHLAAPDRFHEVLLSFLEE